jgi:hypothetical protein
MAATARPWAEGSFRADLARVAATPLFQFLVATAVGTVILFARAPAAYVSPLLFAEDWHWTSLVETRGVVHTALHARGDYAVLGNALLLGAASAVAQGICDDVLALPRCLAVMSYAFFAASFALPVLLLRRQLGTGFCWAAWLLACTLPLGVETWSGFEILGRAVNVGFVFLYIAFVLLWYRTTAVRSFAQALPVDAGLLVCTATNPMCIPMLAAAAWPAARRWLGDRERPATIVREGAFVSLCLLAVACVAVNGLPTAQRPSMDAAPPASFDAAVEIGMARGLLYPIIWPIYRHLSTWSTLALAAGAGFAVWRWGRREHRSLMAGGLATVMLVSAVLALNRGELAAILDGYLHTSPDRYFYAQNLVAMLMLVTFAADLARGLHDRSRLAWLPAAGLGCLAVAAMIHEPPGRVTASQFYLADDGATEAAARRACREGRFVDARRRPGSAGDYVEISVSRLAGAPLLLPRRAVERSLAARTLRRRIALEASATPRF